MTTMAEYVDGLPNICGQESLITEATAGAGPVFLAGSDIDFGRIKRITRKMNGKKVHT